MPTISPSLQEHLDTGATTLAWCWRITREDGEVFGFTEHDVTLTFDGTDFEPETGLEPSEVRQGTDLAVDAQDAQGVLDSDRITETDILDGRWDNATVEAWLVNWSDPAERVLLRRGAIGRITRGRSAFIAEVRGLAHVLDQPVGRAFQATCDAELGDARCGVVLQAAGYKDSGVVMEVLRPRAFTAIMLEGWAAPRFDLGVIEWLSGAAAGVRVEVLRHEIASPEPLGMATITLLEEPVRPVAAGDQFLIYAGCDKSAATCAGRFQNIANFRGFPHIPGTDTMYRYPRRDGENSGAVLAGGTGGAVGGGS